MVADTPRKCLNEGAKSLYLVARLLIRSVIFVNENENENGEKRENNEFVNEN